MRIIAVTNQKGGCGKTTISTALAIYLSHVVGKKVLLIDSDQQANSTEILLELEKNHYELGSKLHSLEKSIVRANPNASPVAIKSILENNKQYSVLKEEYEKSFRELSKDDESRYGIQHLLSGRVKDISDVIYETNYDNLSIIPTDVSLINLQKDFANNFLLKMHLNKLTGFDYVIIDTPPTINEMVINVLNASNLVLIPVMPDAYSIKGCRQTKNYVEQTIEAQKAILRENNVDIDYRIVLNGVDERLIVHQFIISEVKKEFGDKSMNTHIRRQNAAVSRTNTYQTHFMLETGYKRQEIAYDFEALINEMEMEV